MLLPTHGLFTPSCAYAHFPRALRGKTAHEANGRPRKPITVCTGTPEKKKGMFALNFFSGAARREFLPPLREFVASKRNKRVADRNFVLF